ncbi:MAG: hypothetical protein OSB65_19590 [Roseibacillus sp.]|nr:hypothetical protein [Roseibacillus sp.]
MAGSLFPSDQSGVFWTAVGMIGLVFFGITLSLITDGGMGGWTVKEGASDMEIGEARIQALSLELDRLHRLEEERNAEQEFSAELLGRIEVLVARTVEVEELEVGVELEKEAIERIGKEYDGYQLAYRDWLWQDALRRRFDELTSKDGKVYKGMSITKVTAEGIGIRHDSGAANIPARLLPKKLRDELLLDLVESQRLIDERREAELAAIKKRREAKAPKPKPPTPRRITRTPSGRARDVAERPQVIMALREQIAGLAGRLSQLRQDLEEARMRASGAGKARSAPGSLETWGGRKARLARIEARAEAQISVLRMRLREIDPSYRTPQDR